MKYVSIFKILSPLESARNFLQNDHYISHHTLDIDSLPHETIMFQISHKHYTNTCDTCIQLARSVVAK